MIPYGSGEFRGRRRRKKNNPIFSLMVFVALLLGVGYLILRWRETGNSLDNIYVAVALAIAAIALLFYQSGVQAHLERWEDNRRDARMRQFWRDRVAREKKQLIEQEKQDEERRQRRAARREEERLRRAGTKPEDTD